MTREELENRLKENIAKAEKEIQGLPFNPENRHIWRYQHLSKKMVEWRQMLRDFCPPPKPIEQKEDILYD